MRILSTLGALALIPLLCGASALELSRAVGASEAAAGVLPTLVVADRIDVVGERVTVREAVANDQLPAAFLRQRLARAPGPCDTVTLSGAYVEAQLRSALVDSGLRASLEVPLEVEVRGACQLVQPETIQAELQAAAAAALPDIRDLHVELLRPTQEIELAPGQLTVVVAPAAGEDWIGHTTVPVRLLVDGRVAHETRAQLRLGGWADVWTMTADLSRGEQLEASHVQQTEVLWSDLRHRPVSDLNAVLGMAARRSLHPGWVPRDGDFEVAASVTSGQSVQVSVIAGSLCVRAEGTARGEAAVGEPLAVRVESTGATIRGVLIAPGQVEVRR